MADQKAFSQIRHEVYKFGLQGFDKKVQVNARYEQAIKLGAKPKSWIRPHTNKAEQGQLERTRHQDKQSDDNHHYQQSIQLKQRRKQKLKQKPKQTPNKKRNLKTSKRKQHG